VALDIIELALAIMELLALIHTLGKVAEPGEPRTRDFAHETTLETRRAL
jgi:hypothetical protein